MLLQMKRPEALAASEGLVEVASRRELPRRLQQLVLGTSLPPITKRKPFGVDHVL